MGAASASPFATLSPKALKALAWLRDTQHHKAGLQGSVRTDEEYRAAPMLIEGHKRRITVQAEVMREIHPYITASARKDRMWMPNMVGHQVLIRAGLRAQVQS